MTFEELQQRLEQVDNRHESQIGPALVLLEISDEIMELWRACRGWQPVSESIKAMELDPPDDPITDALKALEKSLGDLPFPTLGGTDSMNEHFNELTTAEAERLACLAEEMGEAIQIIGKVLRHGYESRNPFHVQQHGNAALTNRQMLEKELGHVRHWMIEMCLTDDLSKAAIHRAADAKKLSVRPYLHHQSREGNAS